ncbi:conserved hypothetical protein [Verrucomicrobia bacterium]|nr:conserved hypothetical protein [Verrucomicrobiota bacterium]
MICQAFINGQQILQILHWAQPRPCAGGVDRPSLREACINFAFDTLRPNVFIPECEAFPKPVTNPFLTLKACFTPKLEAEHLRRGRLGERAAKKHLQRHGMKFLTANFRSPRGEIDLILRDDDCLVFTEVKTRSSEDWQRPAAAVDAERRGRLSRAALDYLRLIKNPPVKIRFDIVEVLLSDGAVREIRHLPNTFPMEKPLRYG